MSSALPPWRCSLQFNTELLLPLWDGSVEIPRVPGKREDSIVNDATTRSPPEGSADDRMEGWMEGMPSHAAALTPLAGNLVTSSPGGEAERVNRGTDFLPFRCLRFDSAAWSDTSQQASQPASCPASQPLPPSGIWGESHPLFKVTAASL